MEWNSKINHHTYNFTSGPHFHQEMATAADYIGHALGHSLIADRVLITGIN